MPLNLAREFKTFAMRGNVMDMAVGVIVGGAFGKIVSSLVSDILMPPLGLLLGKVDFKDLVVVLKDAKFDDSGREIAAAVTLRYGMFIDTVVSFLIIAFAVFLLVKAINATHRREVPKPATAPPSASKQEILLTEIRDLLKHREDS